METRKTLVICMVIAMLFITITAKAYGQQEKNLQTFFNTKAPGIRMQIDATARAKPKQNITFTLKLTSEPNVQIELLQYNLTIYGFINGTDKIKIYSNTTTNSFELTDIVSAPEQAYGALYGEITLTYRAYATDPMGTAHEYYFKDLCVGFSMTCIENVYLKALEDEVNRLKEEYESLSGLQNELNGARTVTAVLGVTTVIFLGTTAYMLFRRPKTYW